MNGGLEQAEPARRPRILHIIRTAPLECAFALLLLFTLAAVTWGDRLLDRTFTIDPASAGSYLINGYGDSGEGGRSTLAVDPRQKLKWSCELKDGFDYPYCGYEVLFGGWGNAKGLNFEGTETIALDISYSGPGQTIRLNIKNFDPRYSRADRPDSAKPNKVELFVRNGVRQQIEIRPADFSVAEWWLSRFSIPTALSRPQFDNIIGFDIQTGSSTGKGVHKLQIHSITFERSLLSRSDWYFAILAIWVAFAIIFLAIRLRRLSIDLKTRKLREQAALHQAKVAEECAGTDALTSVLNRRGLAERYQGLVAQSGAGSWLSFILVDIDHFKRLNDTFGHNCGDQVLAAFATILKHNAAPADLVARWGGEEFLMICAGDQTDAMAIADSLRAAIEGYDFGECGQITASFGIHAAKAGADELTELVALADAALYTAKQRGRNRAVFYTASPQLVA